MRGPVSGSGDLRAFLGCASEVAEVMFRPEGQMLAYFYVEKSDGKYALIAHPMDDKTERLFREGVPMMLRREGARRWCFFTEAWMVDYAGAEAVPAPKRHPERMEVVVFRAEDGHTGEVLDASRQIYRAEGRPASLLPLVIGQGPTEFVMDTTATASAGDS